MSDMIIIKTEVINSKIMKFLNEISNYNISIAKIYSNNKTTEIIFNVELMGYKEPHNLFDDIKYYVIDVWYTCIGSIDLKSGKNCNGYEWYSCLKQYKKNKKSDKNE